MTEKVDRVGAVASTLCAVHCALCALLPAAFGALGVGFLLGQGAELAFTLVAIGFALVALVMGWRTHGSTGVLVLMVAGITGLIASRGLEMASGHDHHDEHAAEKHEPGTKEKTASHKSDEHGDAHEKGEKSEAGHEEHHEDGDSMHGIGAIVGVGGGLLLLLGHIFNIRATRRVHRT